MRPELCLVKASGGRRKILCHPVEQSLNGIALQGEKRLLRYPEITYLKHMNICFIKTELQKYSLRWPTDTFFHVYMAVPLIKEMFSFWPWCIEGSCTKLTVAE